MFVGKRLWLDGRVVVAVAACGPALRLVWMSVAQVRGIRDQLLIHDAAWAAGMAVVLGGRWRAPAAGLSAVGRRPAARWSSA